MHGALRTIAFATAGETRIPHPAPARQLVHLPMDSARPPCKSLRTFDQALHPIYRLAMRRLRPDS